MNGTVDGRADEWKEEGEERGQFPPKKERKLLTVSLAGLYVFHMSDLEDHDVSVDL